MARRAHDWEALARAWLTDKRKTPTLSQREFFRQRGISASLGNRRIGARMVADWEAVQAQARQQAIEAVGNDLGAEAGRFIKLGKTAVQIGARNIFPRVAADGSELPPPHQPSSFAESLALMREGRTLTEVGITLLTGGEPLKPESKDEVVLEFVPPPSSATEHAGEATSLTQAVSDPDTSDQPSSPAVPPAPDLDAEPPLPPAALGRRHR